MSGQTGEISLSEEEIQSINVAKNARNLYLAAAFVSWLGGMCDLYYLQKYWADPVVVVMALASFAAFGIASGTLVSVAADNQAQIDQLNDRNIKE